MISDHPANATSFRYRINNSISVQGEYIYVRRDPHNLDSGPSIFWFRSFLDYLLEFNSMAYEMFGVRSRVSRTEDHVISIKPDVPQAERNDGVPRDVVIEVLTL